MNRLITALCISVCLCSASCKKHDAPYPGTPEGNYSGTFQRVTGNAGPKANVTINFHNGKFSGTSDSSGYPYICQGTFRPPVADSIQFADSCFFIPEYDWTLILSGTYNFTQSGNDITITRTYPGIIYSADIYKLHKIN